MKCCNCRYEPNWKIGYAMNEHFESQEYHYGECKKDKEPILLTGGVYYCEDFEIVECEYWKAK